MRKYRHGFFKTWRPVRNSCGTAKNLSSAFTTPTVAGKTVSKTSICSSYITNFLVGGRIIKKSETAVGCGTVQVRLSQCSFCTKNILQHLAHSETPTAWPKTLQRQISLEKKHDPNCPISWYSQRSFRTPFVFLSRPQRWLSCNPCYNNLFRGPFAVKAETLQSLEKDWAWPWHALAMFLPTVFLTCAAKNKKAELRNWSDNEKLSPTTSWSQPIAALHSQSRDAHDTRLKPLL